MTILFVLMLCLLVLPLWVWLLVRIWPDTPQSARATFMLILPVYFWGGRQWHNRELALKPLLLANLVTFLLLIPVGYKAFEVETDTVLFGRQYAQEKQRARAPASQRADMARWCKDNNDATYDPVLGTCVETGKAEAIARSIDSDIFGRLSAYLNKRGVKGEFDHSLSAAALQPQLAGAEVAKITAFYFLPMSMSQPPVSVLLCVSEAACSRYEENAVARGLGKVDRSGNLLLVTPAESAGDSRIDSLRMAFARFKPA